MAGFATGDRLDLHWRYTGPRFGHRSPVLLMGSCFAERMGGRLRRHLFDVTWQPAGTLFDPMSLHRQLRACFALAEGRPHGLDLENWQELDGVWHHWDFHSKMSHTQIELAKAQAEQALAEGAEALSRAEILVLTFGTAYAYALKSDGSWVANCHRFPATLFERRLLEVRELEAMWQDLLQALVQKFPNLHIWLTVSPVRHARDGLIDNNRSKGRLIDLVHRLVAARPEVLHYIPSYEWLIDVLRDYRYYDIDLVHPNYAGTAYVYDRLVEQCMTAEAADLLGRIEALVTADSHKPRFEGSIAHQRFEDQRRQQWEDLLKEHPYLANRPRSKETSA